MSDLQIMQSIKNIILSKMKNSDKIADMDFSTPLLSIGIDSIFALSILVDIEEHFNIEIDDSDLNMDKIKDISSFAGLVKIYL